MFRELLFKFLAWFIPTEKDLVKSKYTILQLLFTCEHQSITSKESIELMESVQKEFDSELGKRYLNSVIEVEEIDKYFKKKESN